MDVECLTADEVAALTGFSRSHVYRHRVAFGGFEVGRGVRFSAAVVHSLIQSNDPGAAANSCRGLASEVPET